MNLNSNTYTLSESKDEIQYLCTMENKVIKNEKYVKVSQNELLSLVSSKLKERILFPEKVETAKKFLNNLHYKPLVKKV